MKLYTPFSTRLSGSARETELRLCSIFQWKKKQPPMILIVLVLAIALSCGGLVACREESSTSAASPGFGDIGKTLSELKDEHPESEFVVRLDGFPDSAAICFGEPEAEYISCFFVTQSWDAEKAMNEYEDQLKCAGFITTANKLFPDMEDDMSFEDFFSLIGVEDYEHFLGEDTITAEGWLKFTYNDMEVVVNTNEPATGGGGNVTGAEIVKCDAPASIVDPEIFLANEELATSIMFQEEISTLPYSAPSLDYQEPGLEQASAPAVSRDFDPSKHEIVTALEGEPRDGGDISVPFFEPCACGGRIVTYRTGETGFQKQEYHICKHGMNGHAWRNVVSYVYHCESCGSGAPFTRTVEEVRCNH